MAHALHTMIRDLHRPRGRERRNLCLAEGVRLVEEAVAAGVPIRAVVTSPALEGTERGARLKAVVEARAAEALRESDEELRRLAATEQPQGILAVLAYQAPALDQIAVGPRSVVMVLDAVQDPGNAGTIVRTAHALGAAGVVSLPGTVEVTNPKMLRATMGSVFRIPVVPATEAETVEWLAARRMTVVTAAVDGIPLGTAELPRPMALVVGNEGAGARSALAAAAAHRVAIPIVAGAESLNVAVAAGILLYGATRG
jgi:TrmH family RNA methyltransferase